MDDPSKLKPMSRLADVLHELEAAIYRNVPEPSGDPICEKCWGTGTEIIRDAETKDTVARPCSH
jgi:hypothetical protein